MTTNTGTTITLEERHGDTVVILDNPDAPDDMRHCEVGRVVDGGFQPAMFCPWALTAETLRAIAQEIDPAPAVEALDGDLSVYMIEEYDPDDVDRGRYAGWKTPDPEDGIWLIREVAQEHVDRINEERLARWLVGNNGYVDDQWHFDERLSRWKTENFDKPDDKRTPRPKRVKRTAENYPQTNNARVIAFPVIR